ACRGDPGGGGRRVMPPHVAGLGGVGGGFEAEKVVGTSRLVVTSRFPFTLEGLEQRLSELPLPPLSEAAQRKLERRQREAAADAGLSGQAFGEREKLLSRVPGVARGNPGLQDLIGRKLVLSSAVAVERAERTLKEMEAWLKQGDLPSDGEVRGFWETLAVDALLELAGKSSQALLRSLTVFDLPVPEKVAAKLEEHQGGSLEHLRDLGLVDVSPDMVDPRMTALSVNALAAGRLEPLSDSERTTLAAAIARDLFIAWGGTKEKSERPVICDLQLTKLGLMAEDVDIVPACALTSVFTFTPPAHA